MTTQLFLKGQELIILNFLLNYLCIYLSIYLGQKLTNIIRQVVYKSLSPKSFYVAFALNHEILFGPVTLPINRAQ